MHDYTSEIEIPYGYCHCGCGQKTNIATRNDSNAGLIKGNSRKFCLGHGIRKSPLDVRFWNKVNKDGSIPAHCPELGQCWEWTGFIKSNGYGHIGNEKRNQETYTHRISWILAYGSIPNDLWVLHKCDNPSCVKPEHLFLGTNQDNVDDKVQKNRQAKNRGMKSGNRKLTDFQVEEIRERYATKKISQCKLASEYGVAQQQISRIVNLKRWIE